MVDDTILGPFAILPVRPMVTQKPLAPPLEPKPSPSVATADPAPPPARRANPFTLFLILILLLASQGQLALKRGVKSTPQPDPGIN